MSSGAETKRLPPAEVDCRWWKQGYCARGKTCYFRHDEALAGVDNVKPAGDGGKGKAKAKFNASAELIVDKDGPSSRPNLSDESPPICTICLEAPDTFGLLLNCDHVFCLECIRNWRASTTAPIPGNDELKSTSKTCPMCRSHSDFIIPSSLFPLIPALESTTDGENTGKKEIVDRYLSKLKRIPCRYFEQSIEDSSPSFRPKCKFGNRCHYAHNHPITKEPYIFTEQERDKNRLRRSRNRARLLDEMAIMERMFSNLGHSGLGSDDEWGCDEEEDMAFFEPGSAGFSFDLNLDFEEFDRHYGLDYGLDYGWD